MALPSTVDPEDEPLLEEVQDNFTDDSDRMEPIKTQANVDMRFVDGDGWDPGEKIIRDAAGRPYLWLDEISQYENTVINDIRANKRAVKFAPVGDGANDATARFYGNLMREIEYRSNAQIAYTTALANAVWRSFGYVRLTTRFKVEDVPLDAEPSSAMLDQEIWIEEISDPNSILPDMTFKRPDLSDIKHLFVMESYSHKEFTRLFPDAKIQSFSSEVIAKSGGMVTAKDVTLAEYWRFVSDPGKSRTLALVEQPGGESAVVFLDSFKDGKPPEGFIVKRERKIEGKSVKKILTNGVEVLERTDWAGKYIPFAGCFGKMLWRDSGDGSKRVIQSMTRLARDPAMLYCYYETAMAELIRLTPKFPYFFREGSLSPAALELLQKSYDEPVVAIPVKGTYDGAPPGQEIPFPARAPFEPPIQALMAGAEGARRAIQAAMGQSFLPTQAQGRNEKSGVALKQIKDAGQQGTYHFIDSYNHMLRHVGVMCEDLIPKIYDTPREVSVIEPDGSALAMRINAQGVYEHTQGDGDAPETLENIQGNHAVTISVGPSDDSEREAGTDYTASLVGSPEILQMAGPQKAMKLLALITKLRNLGPYGDAIAEIFDPSMGGKGPQVLPPEVQAHLMEAKKIMDALQQENAGMKQALETKQVEQAGKMAQIQAQGEIDKQLGAQADLTKIQIAELQAHQKEMAANQTAAMDQMTTHLRALELELEAIRQGREDHSTERQLVHEAEMAETDHQRSLEAGQQAHDQALEAGEVAHGQNVDLLERQPVEEPTE